MHPCLLYNIGAWQDHSHLRPTKGRQSRRTKALPNMLDDGGAAKLAVGLVTPLTGYILTVQKALRFANYYDIILWKSLLGVLFHFIYPVK